LQNTVSITVEHFL